jgi:hypothetical protein
MRGNHGRSVVMLGALFLLAACSESATETQPPAAEPWTAQFIFGNTSINTRQIVTNQDGVSASILTDYVEQSQLPNADLELFVTHIYIPTANALDTRLSSIGVTAGYTNGSRTGNFYRGGEFVQRATVGGQLYDVFRLEGMFLGSPALRPTNFANVVFAFRVEYLNGAGSVLHSSNKSVEVYKR